MKPTTSRNGGFSIIELMVALTIGLLIVAAMLQNLTVASGSNRSNARVAEFQGNGRYAADFLRREIQHAGFAGVSWSHLTLIGSPSVTNDCATNFAANIAQPIWGANDSNPFSGTCITTASKAGAAGGDILVLRRADIDEIPTTTTLSATNLYFRSEYLQGSVFVGPTRPANLQAPVADYLLRTDVYYIKTCTSPPGTTCESPPVPALYRMTLGTGPAMTAQLVASNIENMQIQYGVNTSGSVRFYNANDPDLASQWTGVMAIRLWLLARSSEVDPGYSNTAQYAMGDQTVTAADGYQRQVFPLVVQIRK